MALINPNVLWDVGFQLSFMASLGLVLYTLANPPEWIEVLHPQVALLSVAAGDREGRPSPEGLEAVKHCTPLCSDRNGWIELSTDGEQMWVKVERK